MLSQLATCAFNLLGRLGGLAERCRRSAMRADTAGRRSEAARAMCRAAAMSGAPATCARAGRRALETMSAMRFDGTDGIGLPPAHGLYDPALDKDSCGVGFIADIKGRKSHQIVEDALDDPAATSSIAARSAPIRAPATAPASWCRSRTSSSPARPPQARLHAAEARRLRRRRAVHAARPGLAAGHPRHLCADDHAQRA